MQEYYNNINRSLDYLKQVLQNRLDIFFQKEKTGSFIYPPMQLEQDDSPLSKFLVKHKVNIEEYIILLLSLIPHIQPGLLDSVIQQYLPGGGDFPEIGGTKGNNHRATIPTGETALFILAGNDISGRLQVMKYFSNEHFFAREQVLQLEAVKEGEPKMSGKIILLPEFVELFTLGVISKPNFSPDFPAKLVTTKMEWKDAVLHPKTEQSINDIQTWMYHNDRFMNEWRMDRIVKQGYRALFYGPPGTGKTLIATLLGKQFNKDVYRIDLSQVVSKYIGETEKNLEKIFNKAENKSWILFFDEADALFGKRSNVQNAHDKYANQEVSYLLQRVEDFSGLIILASNYKSNIDAAFIRRFNAIIHFPIPNAEERYRLWINSIPSLAALSDEIDIQHIASKYELSGSAIVSVVHYASLQAISRNNNVLERKDIINGIKQEYEKEERVFG